ncbi:MAG: hypothetical protein EBU90_25470 [Proteobacteria bacterium]|nr:hypothetical protein [Pseudomonadota bacterium]NBP16434.1 hypothetical protein [bacterium]
MNLLKFGQFFESATQSVVDELPDKNFVKNPVQPRITYSKKFEDILKTMEDNDEYLAFEMLWLGEPTSKYFNGLGITNVDVSNRPYHFLVTIAGKKYDMKIGKFLRYYWPSLFSETDIRDFITQYNDLAFSGPTQTGVKSEPISVTNFSYNPKNVRSTFLSLTTKTYPHFPDCRHEKEVLQFLPGDLKRDKVGNFYKIVGDANPTTMFTCHLDTADSAQVETNLLSVKGRVSEEGYSFRLIKTGSGDEIIHTDGRSILGADDKAGTAVMLYMIDNNVPGLYYFFIGEERGGVGSNALSSIFTTVDYLQNIKRCVSFDRRRTTSIITHQLGRQCCSNEFGQALAREYSKGGVSLSLDTTGVYTDSASFMDDISECTNISVGYYNEHRTTEMLNITYLEKLAVASTKVDWNSLPSVRKVGYNQEILKKHKELIDEIKKSVFGLDVKVTGEQERVFIRIDLEEPDINAVYDGLVGVQELLLKYNLADACVFDKNFVKIELK